MAILGFHFSGVYKKALYDGTKTATIMDGENFYHIGQEVLVYLSEKPNLFDGKVETRIGKAIIEKIEIKKVEQLNEGEAINCGSENLEELKQALQKWYGATEESIITYIKFKLTLNS